MTGGNTEVGVVPEPGGCRSEGGMAGLALRCPGCPGQWLLLQELILCQRCVWLLLRSSHRSFLPTCRAFWLLAVGLKFSGACWEALGEVKVLSPKFHPVWLPADAQIVLSSVMCLKRLLRLWLKIILKTKIQTNRHVMSNIYCQSAMHRVTMFAHLIKQERCKL